MSDASEPPTPDGVPVLGNAWAFSRDPIGAMEGWSELGDLVRLRVLGESMYLVTGPDLIEEVLVDDQEHYTIGPAQRDSFEDIEDEAVTTTTGDRWKRLRRALHPAFGRDRMSAYGDRMAATTATFVDDWTDGESFELTGEMRQLAVTVLGDALLDTDLGGREAVVMAAADAVVDRANFRRPGQLLPDWIPTPTDRRFARAGWNLEELVDAIIDTRQIGDPADRDDVCSVLLAAHAREELTLDEIRHNLVALLMAGHESPSTALTHVLRLLDEHPGVRETLREEYDAVVEGDRPEGEDYDALDRTRNVVKETLRLFPPTTGVSRQATTPVTLGCYDLPAGAQFIIPQWVPHRDERWWTDPETFDPGRWERETDRPRFAYFPFSGGPRTCIGDQFARRELALALATIVGRVELEVSMEGPLTFTPSIQLRPENDITATVRKL